MRCTLCCLCLMRCVLVLVLCALGPLAMCYVFVCDLCGLRPSALP